ncbi:MAG: hypothetical protein B7Y12_09095 [Rhizobiales bacterium 24-66-13]|nr:MAG: hypothetical protein B7Y95_02740 [Rhizobiales bacterium 32-66-11]OYY88679.1 MAG: hypothetical protein B7Y61_01680 [Rhizobiales bacterium 35-66-30]OYZ79005.1 MAG: hypothetical protein B7Y12_09095 [Rhizobiales bacterium 24-66-13]OZB10746.1 MAG: hypothetical protein B7X67_05855 [Rhizobiales bacterium 39-66-18]
MSRLKAEPQAIESMLELLATAATMEREAVAGYRNLATRMRAEGRPDLAQVFDALVAEELGHLGQVDEWSKAAAPGALILPAQQPPASGLFDDEGASFVAPEMLTSYRAFSIAVRNEECAFAFWTYVAAHAPTTMIRQAAERMANEELGHVATLRRERRRAFHDGRRSGAQDERDLPALESRLAELIDAVASHPQGAAWQVAEPLPLLAQQARERAAGMAKEPFRDDRRLPRPLLVVPERAVVLCELLLDAYLDLAEREKREAMRERAQTYAGGLIRTLSVLRTVSAPGEQKRQP